MKMKARFIVTLSILVAITLSPVAHAQSLEDEGNQLFDKIQKSFFKAALKGKTKLQEAVNEAIDESMDFVDKLTEY